MVMAVDRVSETVALTTRPAYKQTSVYSQFEVAGHRRHKQEIKLKPVLTPVKYSDTAYVFINNTRKRFVSRTYYEPRNQPRSFSETTYANPTTTQERFVSFLDAYADQVKSWYKTSVELKPRNFKSSLSCPNISSSSSASSSNGLANGLGSNPGLNSSPTNGFGDVDENMNTRIPVFQEKYDPGASQVFIPKRREWAPPAGENESLLDSISGQILVNFSDNDTQLCNGYANLNGHTEGVSEL